RGDSASSGGGRRSTVSPLVDLRCRLADHGGTEVFSVATDERAYWRLTALDTFDGVVWSSNDSYRPARDTLGRDDGSPPVPTVEVLQSFRIESLASIWLPAAYRPVEARGVRNVGYNAEAASLITDRATTDGLAYQVRSLVPRLDPSLLAGGATPVPPALARFLELPAMPDRVARDARAVTARAVTPYARARALQDWFQTFTYDLSFRAPRSGSGHSSDAIVAFLNARRGSCEQFAGTFAVMARLLGLPARVAVGFTPGELGADGRYHVRDEHAHAWPEVWFAGAGWVAFEPTPGRGAPGAQPYTGLPEAQAASGVPNTATTLTMPAPEAAPGEEEVPAGEGET
ncbi:MAG: transglutaminaseTgpA domain-containing protein, partial [Acidimicrobiales bacterium]